MVLELGQVAASWEVGDKVLRVVPGEGPIYGNVPGESQEPVPLSDGGVGCFRQLGSCDDPLEGVWWAEGSGPALVHSVRDTCFYLSFGGRFRNAGAPDPQSFCVCAVPTSGANRIPAQLWRLSTPPSLAFLGPESVSRSGMLTQLL